MRVLSITIPPELSGKSVREVLRGRLKLSAGAVTRARKSERGILLCGERVFTNAVVREGDVLCVEIAEKENAAHFEPLNIPLDILFEDEDLLILNKPAGMAVYAAAKGGREPALANAVSGYLGEEAVIHFVSRLDRGTSGILVVAKNAYAHEALRRQQHTERFMREYLALSKGIFETKKGEISLPIARGQGVRRIVSDTGKPACTRYEVIGEQDGISLVRLTPLTGRTHQLRVHMSAAGHPLLGDWLYGSETPLISRPALHSAYLSFCHPVSGEPVRVECPMPEDMKRIYTGEIRL